MSVGLKKDWKFNVGDRVQRRENVFNNKSRLMRGRVVARSYRVCDDQEIYSILWDHLDNRRDGYFDYGLDEEKPKGQ